MNVSLYQGRPTICSYLKQNHCVLHVKQYSKMYSKFSFQCNVNKHFWKREDFPKAFALSPPEGNNKGHNMNTQTTGIYLLKVNYRNNRARYETYSKLTIKTPEWRQWHRSGVFILNFEHISHLFLVFLLNMELPARQWVWQEFPCLILSFFV